MIVRRQHRIFFFFNDTATTEIYTLSLHDALPIYDAHRAAPLGPQDGRAGAELGRCRGAAGLRAVNQALRRGRRRARSEEHTSELQSLAYLVCRLLLEKKKRFNSPWLACVRPLTTS